MLYLIAKGESLLSIYIFCIFFILNIIMHIMSYKCLMTTYMNRYRKMHLSGTESQLFNVPSMIQNEAIFNTDFGVKFATFTSYDLLFYEPALRMTRIEQITDIVHPTAWFSGVPFLTGNQIATRYIHYYLNYFIKIPTL